MLTDDAVSLLSALGQSTRLEAFRRLMRAGPDGLNAGEIAAGLGVPRNTLSTHLSILAGAGLVRSQRVGRQIIYRAEMPRLAELTAFLVEGCCDGKPELCEPAVSQIRALTECE